MHTKQWLFAVEIFWTKEHNSGGGERDHGGAETVERKGCEKLVRAR